MAKLYFDAGTWVVPGKQARGALPLQVPASPAELADWLNARGVQPSQHPAVAAVEMGDGDGRRRVEFAAPATPLPRPSSDCPACHRSPVGARMAVESEDLTAIENWILDDATPTQIENIFECLGARFHQQRTDLERARA